MGNQSGFGGADLPAAPADGAELAAQLALEAAGLGTWQLDLITGAHAVRSPRHDEIFGYREPQPTWSREIALRHVLPEDRPALEAGFARALESGRLFYQVRVRWPDDSLHWIAALGRVDYDAAGCPVRMAGVVSDITDHRRTEATLHHSEEKYRTLFDTMDEGFCLIELIFDAEGQPVDFLYLETNAAFIKHATQPMLGRRIKEIVPDFEQFWIDQYARVAVTGVPARVDHMVEGLGTQWFQTSAVRVGGEGSRVVAVLFTNVTERKRAEQALREADRRKDEFLATLAHELRNPLAPICNSLHVLRQACDDRATVERVYEMLERQVNHMVRLVDDLMEVSRITRGAIELRKAPMDLSAVLETAMETSRALMEAANQQLSVDLPAEPLLLEADAVRLAQVMANLLNNAAKYTAEGGHIWLVARREGDKAVISVRDNGMGIPASLLPRVFDLFTQGDHGYNRAQGGLGIGLTLVRSLVEMHGGSVEARSEGLERGSEFVVRLPLAKAIASATGSKPGQPTAARTQRHILVVDDNRDAAESLAMLLRLHGAEVLTASDGAEALALLPGFKPSVVLLDIGMPGMDGYELARRLRQTPQSPTPTLIALTGWGQEEDRRRSREAGIHHHLVKPLQCEALLALLATLPSEAGVPAAT